MKEIDIRITKARIAGYVVELKKDFPDITATIELLTESGKKVSTYSISTEWYNNNKFELPAAMIPAIKEISEKLEGIVVNACNKEQKLIA